MTTSLQVNDVAVSQHLGLAEASRQLSQHDLQVQPSQRVQPSQLAQPLANQPLAPVPQEPVINAERLRALSDSHDYYATVAQQLKALEAEGVTLSPNYPQQMAKLEQGLATLQAALDLHRNGDVGEGMTALRNASKLAIGAEQARQAVNMLVRSNATVLLPRIEDFRYQKQIAKQSLDYFNLTLQQLGNRLDPAIANRLRTLAADCQREVDRAVAEAQLSHEVLKLLGEANSEFGKAWAEGLSSSPQQLVGHVLGQRAAGWLGLTITDPQQQVRDELQQQLGELFDISPNGQDLQLRFKPELYGKWSVAETVDRLNTLRQHLQQAGNQYALPALDEAIKAHPSFRLTGSGDACRISLTPQALQQLEQQREVEPSQRDKLETRLILAQLRPALKAHLAYNRWDQVANTAQQVDNTLSSAASQLHSLAQQTGSGLYHALPDGAQQVVDGLGQVPAQLLTQGSALIGQGLGTVGGWIVGGPLGNTVQGWTGQAGGAIGGATGHLVGQWLADKGSEGLHWLSEAPSVLHDLSVDVTASLYRGLQNYYQGPDHFEETLQQHQATFGTLFQIEGDPDSGRITVRNDPAWNNRHPDALVTELNKLLSQSHAQGDQATIEAIRQGVANSTKVDFITAEDGTPSLRRRNAEAEQVSDPSHQISPQQRLTQAVQTADAARRLCFLKMTVCKHLNDLIEVESQSASSLFNFHSKLTQAKVELLKHTMEALVDCPDQESMAARLDEAIQGNLHLSKQVWQRPDGGKTDTVLTSLHKQVGQYDLAAVY
ncbi:hypothetical protein [Chitinimonas lacunae]|uniref:Uncharacterized protein n=1 Tax=Chitinimonas lacunae TaxID=1963018 RepID=A0ABV8MPA5_9NEIS